LQNRFPFILCLIGGVLLVTHGATGSIGFLQLIADIPTLFPQLLGIVWLIKLVLYVLIFLAGLGGISVIIGGFFLTKGRLTSGKFLIMLGAGLGLIGLLVSLGQILYTSGFGALVSFIMVASQSAGWVGAVLSIIARMTAGKSKQTGS
jgi:hypothetical protein